MMKDIHDGYNIVNADAAYTGERFWVFFPYFTYIKYLHTYMYREREPLTKEE